MASAGDNSTSQRGSQTPDSRVPLPFVSAGKSHLASGEPGAAVRSFQLHGDTEGRRLLPGGTVMGANEFRPGPRALARGFRYRSRPLVAALALAGVCEPALAEPVTHIVTRCDDIPVVPDCNSPDDGTLRQAFSCAQDGDKIDLTQLQCSAITLGAP